MTNRLFHRLAAVLATGVVLAANGNKLEAAGDSPKPSQAPTIGIGHGEEDARTHLQLRQKHSERRENRAGQHAPDRGQGVAEWAQLLRDPGEFPEQDLAHGGPQLVKRDGKPFMQANWGGLVNRGGGSKDYKEVDWKNDLLLIQCGIGKPNTVPWEWQLHQEYILTVRRGKQVHLPAAKIQDVQAPERTMWEWHFTIEPLKKDKSHPAFASLIYNSADCLRSFYLWNESGYGSHSDEQHTRWSLPTYRTEDGTEDVVARDWRRF